MRSALTLTTKIEDDQGDCQCRASRPGWDDLHIAQVVHQGLPTLALPPRPKGKTPSALGVAAATHNHPGGRMSHIVSIKTELRDPEAVRAACRRLNLPEPVQG